MALEMNRERERVREGERAGGVLCMLATLSGIIQDTIKRLYSDYYLTHTHTQVSAVTIMA